MIRGIHAALYVPDNYFEGISFFRDRLGISMIREYKAGAKDRDQHGSPSWAEFPGVGGVARLVVAAEGVFGKEQFGGPAFIVDSTEPELDAADLVRDGFVRFGEPVFDRWWHEIAIVTAPDGLVLILVGNTGDRTEAVDEEGKALELLAPRHAASA